MSFTLPPEVPSFTGRVCLSRLSFANSSVAQHKTMRRETQKRARLCFKTRLLKELVVGSGARGARWGKSSLGQNSRTDNSPFNALAIPNPLFSAAIVVGSRLRNGAWEN